MAADFGADMAERWQRLTVKTGGILFGKTSIPFGKEGDIVDQVMTKIIQQHNNSLRSNKQRIVRNLNNIDCLIYIAVCIAEDIDAATITLHDIFYQYKYDDGVQLLDRFVLNERNTETVDNML
jgi:hypothetical protein